MLKFKSLVLIGLLLICCDRKNVTNKEFDKDDKIMPKEILPSSTNEFEFYKSGMDDDHSQMEIYVFKKKFNKYAFLDLVNKRKANFQNISSGTFCLVIFDSSDFAAFPKNPFSAYYGVNEFRMKHIKAFYMFNSKNNFEELRMYKHNMWDSTPE